MSVMAVEGCYQRFLVWTNNKTNSCGIAQVLRM